MHLAYTEKPTVILHIRRKKQSEFRALACRSMGWGLKYPTRSRYPDAYCWLTRLIRFYNLCKMMVRIPLMDLICLGKRKSRAFSAVLCFRLAVLFFLFALAQSEKYIYYKVVLWQRREIRCVVSAYSADTQHQIAIRDRRRTTRNDENIGSQKATRVKVLTRTPKRIRFVHRGNKCYSIITTFFRSYMKKKELHSNFKLIENAVECM